MIFVCEKGVPTLSCMERAEKVNDDGAGIAWRESAGADKFRIRWKKGLKAKEVDDLIKEMKLADYLPDSPFVIHFRSRSTGSSDHELNQPFPLTREVSTSLEGTAKEVLFHNGTYHNWLEKMNMMCFAGGTPIPGGKWNDSRFLAWAVVNRGLGALMLTDNGGGGRIAVLSHEGTVSRYGEGWQKGEQEGVIQSGAVRPETSLTSWDPLEWNKRHGLRHHGREIEESGRGKGASSEGANFRPPKDFDSLLYEESDKVELYSIKELLAMNEELKKDIDSYGGMVSC